MALTEAQKDEFIDAYTKALLSSWSDDEYAARLESDPRAALAEVGLDLPASAKIEITRGAAVPDAGPQEGRLDRQVALYETGLESGVFEFHIPATPQIDTSELDMDELAEVAGGGGIYCCCCPCCCCG